jgi:hypothetical protein
VSTSGTAGAFSAPTGGSLRLDLMTVSSVTAVPEPSPYAMALAGLACGGYVVWRRRKQA